MYIYTMYKSKCRFRSCKKWKCKIYKWKKVKIKKYVIKDVKNWINWIGFKLDQIKNYLMQTVEKLFARKFSNVR